ncbi:helix-turn-helix transcriptional regulator [Salinibaculum rarum]|uniref:helix-turn-helix transcriptional regulator n=1 Tax=Salinibaculum rarum TaxID=3058903 RepID=UPI00265D736D|nr:MarR family transcriptional regulator [Salinibaculum sp. KK48]
MADTSAAIDTLSFLTRSEPRTRILLQLLSSGSTSRRQFRDRFSVSRSTITRALTALEERGLVGHDGATYHLTPTGRIVAETIADAVDTFEVTDELSTFLEWFPYSDHDISLDELSAADITVSTDVNPYAPSRKHAKTVSEHDQFRMLLPSIDLQVARSTDDRLKNGDLELEMIVTPEVEETISTGEFASLLREQIECGSMTVLVSPEPIPFYLGLSGSGTVQVGVEDDEGFPRAVLTAETDALRSWGERVYEQFRADARTKPAAEF